ncbi:MAG: hypothetical protein ABIQ35_13890 [Verrucomicrobiota bacterium]
MAEKKHDEHGPHGGTWVAMHDSFIEISVVETNVPPRFRLYFFDAKKRSQPIASDKITLETIRPDGARQLFNFVPHGEFLEGDADIPEPHEFDVNLNVSHGGHSHVFKTKFTEEAHGHSHGPHAHDGHDNGGHGHDHGGGVVGWFRGKFAHSHSAATNRRYDGIARKGNSRVENFAGRIGHHCLVATHRGSHFRLRWIARRYDS